MKLLTRASAAALSGLLMLSPAYAFTDVPMTHPYYASISDCEQKHLVAGIGNNYFAPDSEITATSFITMITRAFYPKNIKPTMEETATWFLVDVMNSVPIKEQSLKLSRRSAYEYLLKACGLEVYSDSLYPKDTNHLIETMKENNLWFTEESDTALTAHITRGEAAELLHRFLKLDKVNFHQELPPITNTIEIDVEPGFYVSSYLRELNKIPENILSDFKESQWKLVVGAEDIQQYNDEYHVNAAGLCDYKNKTIFVKRHGSVIHEFGHFFGRNIPEKLLKDLYQKESAALVPITGDYCLTNPLEYFAEYFSYWIEHRGNSEDMKDLAERTPQTYTLFQSYEQQNFKKIEQ